MPQKISRRDFALKAAGVAAGVVAAPLLRAQDQKPDEKPPVSEQEMADVQAKLPFPLSDAEKKILKDNLSSQKSDEKKRLAIKIAENSEPAFTYIPQPFKKKESE